MEFGTESSVQNLNKCLNKNEIDKLKTKLPFYKNLKMRAELLNLLGTYNFCELDGLN
jgi:hypothetical protein